MKPYIIVDESEAVDEQGNIREGYEKRAYCYVKLIPVIQTIEEQKRKAYQSEADPLWREWQVLLAAGHSDAELRHQEWIAKRAEIQGRFT